MREILGKCCFKWLLPKFFATLPEKYFLNYCQNKYCSVILKNVAGVAQW